MSTKKLRIKLHDSNRTQDLIRRDIPAPNGYDLIALNNEVVNAMQPLTPEALLAAKQKQAFNMSYAPGKALMTTAFMLWMSGSSVQIFSIMMTGMALINPLKAVFSVSDYFKAFSKTDGLDLRIPKMIYVSLQLLAFGVAVYKCSTMGLLPLTSADWISTLSQPTHNEHAGIPL